MKRRSLPIRRTPVRRHRKEPRPGRLDADGMTKLRMQRFGMDDFRCQHVTSHGLAFVKCMAQVTWLTGHLAHIKSRGAGGHDTIENTYTCCAEHHMTFHRNGPSIEKPCKKKEIDNG